MSSLVSVIITELLDGHRISRIQPRKELIMQTKIKEAIMIFGLFSLYIGWFRLNWLDSTVTYYWTGTVPLYRIKSKQ